MTRAPCVLCGQPVEAHMSLDPACMPYIAPEPAVATFSQLCKDLSITPEEREQLAFHLGEMRAKQTYKGLREARCPGHDYKYKDGKGWRCANCHEQPPFEFFTEEVMRGGGRD